MNQRFLVLLGIMAMLVVSGCSGTGAYNGQNWLSNSGTRIAPPGTNLARNPQQVASLPPDPYYGNTPGASVQTNGATGWRPTAPTGANAPVNYNPTNQNIQSVPRNTVPSNNLVVASSTAGITAQPQTTLASNPTPVANPGPNLAPQPGVTYGTFASDAMPVHDATRVATAPVVQPAGQPNTGIFNRTWEYVASPNANYPGNYPANQYAPQPVYANGSAVASQPAPGFAGPRPSSYANAGTYPGYPGVTPVSNPNVAGGWVQRNDSR